MRRTRTSWIGFLLALATCLMAAKPALATQHLVTPGNKWQTLEIRAQPGDEIILMPGNHRPVTLSNLTGAPGNPIIIRGLDPNHPPTIVAKRRGIVLHKPKHVIIKDIIITGATLTGILVDNRVPDLTELFNPTTSTQQQQAWDANLLIRNVTVLKTGPEGKRHAIELRGLRDVRIIESEFEGWGGSAIEIVGSHNVLIEKCTFNELENFSQYHAIQVRAGSTRVNITNCQFDVDCEGVVSLGAVSRRNDFCPSIPENAKALSQYEARYIQLQHCVFKKGTYTIAMLHADDCLIRNNTFIRPRSAVLGVTHITDVGVVAVAKRGIFGGNLIVWEPGDISRYVYFSPKIDQTTFAIEQNLWWSSELAQNSKKLGELPQHGQWPQITDIDPKLDGQYRPTEQKAALFGSQTRN